MTLSWSAHWSAERTATGVVVSAGPDLTFEIDALSERAIAEILTWSGGERIEPALDESIAVASQLLSIGTLESGSASAPIDVCGEGLVADELRHRFVVTGEPGGHDLPDAVATAAPLVDALILVLRRTRELPPMPDTPHLLVDITGHHTLVLGPLVVPGFTACTECLRRRHQRRWPETPIASEPLVANHPALIAELVGIQLRRLRSGSSPLINATIAWDFESGVSTRDDLLRVPGCSGCRSSEVVSAVASVRLPWVEGS